MLTIFLTLAAVAKALPATLSASQPNGTFDNGLPQGLRGPSGAGFKEAKYHPSRGGEAICVSGFLDVTAYTTQNTKLDSSIIPVNQTAFTGFVVTAQAAALQAASGLSPSQPVLQTVNQTFEIGATLCAPANATIKLPKTVELLTHGVGFDRFYWDFAPGYSYVDAAVDAGHAVLMYDRLGIGMSEHPDSLIVQAPIELEIAHSLATMLRSGAIADNKFAHIIGVGHSFGSALTSSLTASYPTLLDAAILTGFGTNGSGSVAPFTFAGHPTIAYQANPRRFGDLPNGYYVDETAQGVQIDFFSSPGFDPHILDQAFAQTQTQSIGEMLGGAPLPAVAKNYTGPLAVVNGANDFPYCLGNCTLAKLEAVRTDAYPGVEAADFGTYAAPRAGHGLNLHYSAGGAYQFIQKFLSEQGF